MVNPLSKIIEEDYKANPLEAGLHTVLWAWSKLASDFGVDFANEQLVKLNLERHSLTGCAVGLRPCSLPLAFDKVVNTKTNELKLRIYY